MEKVRAALVIQNCRVGGFEQNLELTLELSARAADQGAQIAVFPEMNLTGYVAGGLTREGARVLDPEWTLKLSRAAERHNITVLAGLAEDGGNQGLRASHLVFTPDGGVDLYRKIHLAPQEAAVYSAGNRPRTFDGYGYRFGIQLCYDAHFPELSTAMAMDGVDIIFMPHASPRGTPEEKFNSWMRHMTARAFDNGVYVAAVNQCGDNSGGLHFPGVAMVIGPDGLVKSKCTDGCSAVHIAELDLGLLKRVRSHRMRYFLPNRRRDLFPLT